jgi:hypothetical protein
MNRDIDLQKVQILNDWLQAGFDVVKDILIGVMIGLSLLIMTVYYNKQFSSDMIQNAIIAIALIIILFVFFGIFGVRSLDKKEMNL